MLFNYLLILTTVTTALGISPARIFGGQQMVQPGELPFNVLIHLRKPHDAGLISFCGSILSDRWILTAAHLVENNLRRPQDFQVIAGKYDLLHWETSEQVRQVRRVVKHPEYVHFTGAMHDVALMMLDRSLQINRYVQPVGILGSVEYPSGVATVAGYGLFFASGTEATFLAKLSVNILSPIACASGHASWNPSLICTDPGTCEGDSGAPLVQQYGDQWVQIGLVSFGSQCAFYGSPTYYTFVARYVEWINETMVTIENDGSNAGRTVVQVSVVSALLIVASSSLIVSLLRRFE